MRLRWLSVIFVLLSLILTTIPAEAAIIPIRPRQAPKITPDQTAYDKIVKLQDITNMDVLTPVSPDDQSLLIAHQRPGKPVVFEFLNVQDGTTQVVDPDIGSLAPESNLVWLDDNTVTYFSLDIFAEEDADVPVMVQVDRTTGQITKVPVRLPGIPISFSPDATRALLIEISFDDLFVETDGVREYHAPFGKVVQKNFGSLPGGETAEDSGLFDWLSHITPAERHKMGDFSLASDLNTFVNDFPLSLLAYDFASDKSLPLGDLVPDTDLSSIGWAGDSSRLSITHVTLPDIGRGGTLLSNLSTQDSLGLLPPDKNPILQGSTIDTVDFEADQVIKGFLKASNGNGDMFQATNWNSDGSVLAVQMVRPAKLAGRTYPTYIFADRSYIQFFSPDGKPLSTLDKAEIEDPIYSVPEFIGPDELLFNSLRGMSDRIYYYNMTTGEFRQLPIADGLATVVRPTHQSRQVVFGFSSFSQAPDLMRINLDGQALARLTFLNEDVTQFGKVRADQVSYTLANGQVRTGYLLQAADATFPPKPQRMVVWQEGGPTSPMVNSWATYVERPYNLLPHFGMSVLVVPLPGRLGFGPAFLNALADNANFGQIDIDEQAEIVRQSINRGYTRAGSVGITGCSYGGYFSSQSIAKYPDLYAAANSQCTLLDLFNEWQLGYTPTISYLEGRTPAQDGAEYLKDSPFYHAGAIKTPLLLYDGLSDFLPVQASGNFHDLVQATGTAVNLLVFTSAGHGLSSRNDEIIAAQVQIAWFQQYLPDPAPAAPTSTPENLWEKLSLALKQPAGGR